MCRERTWPTQNSSTPKARAQSTRPCQWRDLWFRDRNRCVSLSPGTAIHSHCCFYSLRTEARFDIRELRRAIVVLAERMK